MTKDEALHMALEYLEESDNYLGSLDHSEPIAAIKEALAQPEPEPVGLDVIIDDDAAKKLYDVLGEDREDLCPIRLLVGSGHSGYGLYVAQYEYQDEGADLLVSIKRKPKEQPEPELVQCQYGNGGYACCEGGPCKAEEQNESALVNEPIAFVTGTHAGYFVVKPTDPAMVLPVNMALYTHLKEKPND